MPGSPSRGSNPRTGAPVERDQQPGLPSGAFDDEESTDQPDGDDQLHAPADEGTDGDGSPSTENDTPATAQRPQPPDDDPLGVGAITPADPASGIALGQLSSFGADLPTFDSAPLRVERVAANALLAALLSLLLILPAELFNSTLRVNYERVLSPVKRIRAAGTAFLEAVQRRVRGSRTLGVVAFAGAAALASSALDPQFGTGWGSLRLVLAQTLALFASTFAVCSVGLAIGRHDGATGSIRLRPGGLVVCFAVVLLSRAIGVSPGFLYGLVIGMQFDGPLPINRVGRVALAQAGFLLTVGIGSWLVLGVLHNTMHLPDPGFFPALGAETLTALAIGTTTGLVLSLMPLTYLRGERLFVWSRATWLVTYSLSVFAFLGIAANPVFGSLPSTGSLSIWLGFYALFGVGSVLFWLRYRKTENRSALDRLTDAAPRI